MLCEGDVYINESVLHIQILFFFSYVFILKLFLLEAWPKKRSVDNEEIGM